MKVNKSIPFIILCALLLSACGKKDPGIFCETAECNQYFDMWKSLHKERNNMTEEYFKEHISTTNVQLTSYDQAKVFRVTYEFTLDWATVTATDQFPYYIFKNASPFPSLQIPKEENLTKEEIAQTFESHAWSANMTIINPVQQLQFKTKKDAFEALNSNTDCKFKDGHLLFKLHRPFANEPSNGNIFLESSCTINENENRCLTGEVDLVTGDKEIYETRCWVN